MKRINFRILIIYCLSTILTVISFQILSLLYDRRYIAFANLKNPRIDLNFAVQNKLYLMDLMYYQTQIGIASSIGVLVSFIQFIIIVKKHSLHWTNSVIPPILIFLVFRFFVQGHALYYFALRDSILDLLLKGLSLLLLGTLIAKRTALTVTSTAPE